MKKVLISLIALLTLSMLSASVSAFKQYYMAGFYAEASGCCEVTTIPAVLGKGSLHIKGSAIVFEDLEYRADQFLDPNTRLWTRRTRLTASWNNKKLLIYMWPSPTVSGSFNPSPTDTFTIKNLTFFGCYKGEAGLQLVHGRVARLQVEHTWTCVELYIGTEPFLQFQWYSDKARCSRSVTLWGPIPWHPSGP